MLEALDDAGRSTCCCSARATPSRAEALREQLLAGAGGFKLHEDWGSTPAAIDACLRVGRRDRRAGRDPHRHAQRGRLRRVDARRDRRPRRSTRTTPRARAAATRRTSSRSPRTPTTPTPPPPGAANPTRRRRQCRSCHTRRAVPSARTWPGSEAGLLGVATNGWCLGCPPRRRRGICHACARRSANPPPPSVVQSRGHTRRVQFAPDDEVVTIRCPDGCPHRPLLSKCGRRCT